MKIITFGNAKYKRIALNWATHLSRLNIKNYTIYSLDVEIYDFLNQNKVNTELIKSPMFESDQVPEWGQRFKIIYDQLCTYGSVIHSDLDAIWLKNPDIFISPEYDIISSSGSMPIRIFKQLGLSFCMGWIYFKSTVHTRKLFESIINSNHSFDDQISVNNYLMDQEISHVSCIGDNAKRIVFGDLNTLVLDQSVISRHITHDHGTYVAHPYTRRCVDRESFFMNNGLWCLTQQI